MDLSNENIVHVKKDGIEYLQFKRLLEFKNLVHAYTLSVDGIVLMVRLKKVSQSIAIICFVMH